MHRLRVDRFADALVGVLGATLLAGCFASHSVGGGASGDAGSTGSTDAPAHDAGPPVEFSDGYELVHDLVPAWQWLESPPSGATCWPVRYAPSFPSEAIDNLSRAVESWGASCTRFCLQAPAPDPRLDVDPVLALEGLVAVYSSERVLAVPGSSAGNGHGIFGEVRTESVTIEVGPGRSPGVEEWARAIGLAMAVRVTADGVRDGVDSVLLGDELGERGATATDRGALCRLYPR